MSTPHIAQKANYPIELKPGKYWWCACGHSKNQPFCDGSHRTTDFQPIEFEITESKLVKLCGCKHSAKNHFATERIRLFR